MLCIQNNYATGDDYKDGYASLGDFLSCAPNVRHLRVNVTGYTWNMTSTDQPIPGMAQYASVLHTIITAYSQKDLQRLEIGGFTQTEPEMSLLFEKFSTLKHLTLHRVGTY
jgi:hypothetical protein